MSIEHRNKMLVWMLISGLFYIGVDGQLVHGPDAVISMIDHAFDNFSPGENECTMHADNCFGVCLGETCNTVADCHSTNCQDFRHLGWILTCDSHTCQCTAPKSICDSSPCHNGGRCVEDHSGTKYTCHCSNGFTGTRCQTNNHCDSHPCQNGGSCYARSHSPFYNCNCAIGYSGYNCKYSTMPTTVAPTCTSQSCYHHGHCKSAGNTYGYTCTCLHGFSGQRCEVNTHCDSNPCKNGGTCRPHFANPYYRCYCPRGYYGPSCDYIDKCAENPCPHGFVCERISSTYKCSCIHPQYCDSTVQQVDHCASQPCQHFGRCVNTTEAPYFKCYCRYSFSGETCQTNENCQHNTCRNNGTCVTFNRYPFYTCRCKGGYSGQHCEHYNHCLSSPCPAGTTCQNYQYHPGYLCKCTTTNCQQENKCATKPCQNNAPCSPTTTAPFYHCACPAGYYGINCKSHPCDKQNCGHGTCVKTRTSPYFQCKCQIGFYGYHCEHESCHSNTCVNGGTCTPLDHPPYFTCACLHDFYGGHCGRSRTSTTTTTTTTTTTPVPHGPTCLSCNDVVSPNTCEYITKCGVHERCYIDEFVTSIGSIRFNLGCRDAQHCGGKQAADVSMITSDESNNLICTQCCSGQLCNSGGCGASAFPTLHSGQRGPLCFHCDQQNSPDDCNKIKICGRDEVCFLNTTTVGTSHQTLWMTDCQLSSDCQQKIGHAGTGSGQCQHRCCSQDMCNNAC